MLYGSSTVYLNEAFVLDYNHLVILFQLHHLCIYFKSKIYNKTVSNYDCFTSNSIPRNALSYPVHVYLLEHFKLISTLALKKVQILSHYLQNTALIFITLKILLVSEETDSSVYKV